MIFCLAAFILSASAMSSGESILDDFLMHGCIHDDLSKSLSFQISKSLTFIRQCVIPYMN